ncbi:MAG: hypothetical protein ACYST3_00940 [Planctomycetota bacterium]
MLEEHEEGLFTELSEFYEDEDVDVREISVSVGVLMSGVLGRITVDCGKRDTMVIH